MQNIHVLGPFCKWVGAYIPFGSKKPAAVAAGWVLFVSVAWTTSGVLHPGSGSG